MPKSVKKENEKKSTVAKKKTAVKKATETKKKTAAPRKAKAVKKKQSPSEELIACIIKGLQEKKGFDIVAIDLKPVNSSVCDSFIICHGTSSTQVDALADSVLSEVKKDLGINAWHKEGFENSEWILLDYIDVVVHIFQEEQREFYKLEKLWADADVRHISES